jgi:RNA polymerase sigma-70 factor (ECF subfamily)
MQPELSLLSRLRQGDEDAFAELYRRHKDAVYRFALLWSGSAATAADVTQEAFLAFIAKPETYDPARGSFAAWLCGVARNLARKEAGLREDATDPADLLADHAMPESHVEHASPESRLLADEKADQVRSALAAVAPHYRDVLVLCELCDHSYAEAAMVCGIDIGTVRSRLSRGRAQLAHQLSRRGLMAGSPRVKEAS